MKKKDPTSHRIIEKRRRDRMNNCLADLSKLIPVHYMKKGRGRVEKTEIIEMAIRHLKDLINLSNAQKQLQQNRQEEKHYEQAQNYLHNLHQHHNNQLSSGLHKSDCPHNHHAKCCAYNNGQVKSSEARSIAGTIYVPTSETSTPATCCSSAVVCAKSFSNSAPLMSDSIATCSSDKTPQSCTRDLQCHNQVENKRLITTTTTSNGIQHSSGADQMSGFHDHGHQSKTTTTTTVRMMQYRRHNHSSSTSPTSNVCEMLNTNCQQHQLQQHHNHHIHHYRPSHLSKSDISLGNIYGFASEANEAELQKQQQQHILKYRTIQSTSSATTLDAGNFCCCESSNSAGCNDGGLSLSGQSSTGSCANNSKCKNSSEAANDCYNGNYCNELSVNPEGGCSTKKARVGTGNNDSRIPSKQTLSASSSSTPPSSSSSSSPSSSFSSSPSSSSSSTSSSTSSSLSFSSASSLSTSWYKKAWLVRSFSRSPPPR